MFLTKESSEKVTKALQIELWNEFCAPEENGVSMENVLNGAVDVMNADLTQDQIQSVLAHYNNPDEWTEEDESVRDTISDLTDSEDWGKLLDWYTYTSGDSAADQFLDQYEDTKR